MLTESVNHLLERSDVPAALTIEQCASAQAMSTTTFRRKLAQEDTSFKLIQNKYLNELCVSALFAQSVTIDDLAIKLGYSERATFERAFKQKFGVSPSQFRKLSLQGQDKNSQKKLLDIIDNMPPMPDSCLQLLQEKDNGNLDVDKVVDIVSRDPVFFGRIMGQASKAIYGRTPKDLREAVARNLGINTVVNYAVVFAVKEAMQDDIDPVIVERYSQVFLLAPKLFQLLRKSIKSECKFDIAIVEQVLIFGLLGLVLLSHKQATNHQLMTHTLMGIDDLSSLNHSIKSSMSISIFSASSIMLSRWHIDASVIKQILHLDKVSQGSVKSNQHDEWILFLLSCLYHGGAGHKDFSQLSQKAELLKIDNFNAFEQLVTNLP